MNSLLDSGLLLKQIQLKELSEIIADLNANFTAIQNLPGFRGAKGAAGDSIKGDTGERGNIWCFASATRFISAYTAISSAIQVTTTFLTACINDNETLLYSTLQVDNLVDGDVVVLPTGIVAQLQTDLIIDSILQPPTFIDTGISFAGSTGVTEDRVIELIRNMTEAEQADDTAIFKQYNALAKNYSDSSPGLNISINTDSIVDIDSSLSGAAPTISNYKFYCVKETAATQATQACLLVGNAADYHNLIQNTQNTVGLTNDYAPGVNDWSALTVLQNSYNNGMLIGYGKTDVDNTLTMRDFARIYKTKTALRITSSYSPNPYTSGDYTELLMSNRDMSINASNSISLNSIGDGIFLNGSIYSKHINSLTTRLYLGGSDTEMTSIDGINIRLTGRSNYNFVSTDAVGNIVKKYSYTNELIDVPTAIPSSKAVRDAIAALSFTTSTAGTEMNERLEALESADTTTYFSKQAAIENANLNSLVLHGVYIVTKTSAGNLSNSPYTLSDGQSLILSTVVNNKSTVNDRKQLYQTAVRYANEVQFAYRAAIYNGSAWVFTPWIINVDTNRTITVTGGLVGGGNLTSNIQIQHALSALGASTMPIAANEVYSSISVDVYGHIVGYTLKDLNAQYLRKDQNLADGTAATIRSNISVYSKAETYAKTETYNKTELYNRSEIDAKLVIPDTGYLTVSTVYNITSSNIKARRKGNVVTVFGSFNHNGTDGYPTAIILFVLPANIPYSPISIYASGSGINLDKPGLMIWQPANSSNVYCKSSMEAGTYHFNYSYII